MPGEATFAKRRQHTDHQMTPDHPCVRPPDARRAQVGARGPMILCPPGWVQAEWGRATLASHENIRNVS